MSEKIDKALKSGAIDIDGWDEKNGQYRLPKAVVSALLSDAADSFNGRGTSFEKEQKKDIENIKLFL